VDGGETYRAASRGVSPPNSTFSLVEFRGYVYAGTGYEPYPAEIYRWIGGSPDDWLFVFRVPSPRTLFIALAVYQDRLFAGTAIITFQGWQGSIPVHVTDDGLTFNATSGIPSSCEVWDLLVVDDDLLARTRDRVSGIVALYRWNVTARNWELLAPYDLGHTAYAELLAHGSLLYAYGKRPNDPSAGIYRSSDKGLSWQRVVDAPSPEPMCMHIHDKVLYLGTNRDATGTAYIYRLRLGPHVLGDLNCDGRVSGADIEPFVLALADREAYKKQYPDCDALLADCNRDGRIDFGDINAFVELLGAGPP
jgi:hypothetical protein